MAELFTFNWEETLNSGWKFKSRNSRNNSLKQNNVTNKYLENEKNQESPTDGNNMESLLLDKATAPVRIEGFIVKFESDKCSFLP